MSGLNWHGRWDPFRDLHREVGRLFETLEPLHALRLARHFPALNLYDAGDRYILSAQLPGATPQDLDLSITGETLTIRGERKRPEGIADESYRRQERFFGRWSRTLSLPDRVDSALVTAKFARGLLTVEIPKVENARPRQIAVKSAP